MRCITQGDYKCLRLLIKRQLGRRHFGCEHIDLCQRPHVTLVRLCRAGLLPLGLVPRRCSIRLGCDESVGELGAV
jgi:hypothetical protein